MKNYLIIAQIVVAVLMMGGILLQSRGAGLGTAFGGEGNVYRTKRGVEKVVFRATVVMSVIFLALSLATVVLPRKF
jgi:preprotein translocase subunit SecG